MNIVFVTDNFVSPTSGGITRITHVLARALTEMCQHHCYSVYANAGNHTETETFIWSYCWDGASGFLKRIEEMDDCVIIIQSPCVLAKDILNLQFAHPVKKIVVFHGTPGFEMIGLRPEVIWYRLTHLLDVAWTIRQTFIQLLSNVLPQSFLRRRLSRKYSLPYGRANRIVVLSPGIINQYLSIAPGVSDDFVAIPNALSFDECSVAPDKPANHEVLIVARLDDWHKRILDALKIWRLVQQDTQFSDWKLRIVGDGIDAAFYKDYVRKKGIPNVVFEGHQQPLSYYQQAGIFMMTSACEGLPMTLLEALQCGCVPVVYDNFASAKDIIRSGENGFLIATDDTTSYVASMKQLMADVALRKQMSLAAIQSCKGFTIREIVAMWNRLLSC